MSFKFSSVRNRGRGYDDQAHKSPEQQMDKPGYQEEEVEDGELWPHGTGLQGSLPGWEKIWNPPFSISAGHVTATNQQTSNWM